MFYFYLEEEEDLDPEAMWIAATSTTVRSQKKSGEVEYPTTVRTSPYEPLAAAAALTPAPPPPPPPTPASMAAWTLTPGG